MIKIAYSPVFARAYKKQIKNQSGLQKLFSERVDLFIQDPYHPQLRTHKLKGILKHFHLRVIFYFASDNEVIFENIGKHDEVY